MALNKDSLLNTLLVTIALCVVCALLVSAAAVGLKSQQAANKELDLKKNVVGAAGLSGDRSVGEMTAAEINQVFESRIERKLVDIASGKFVEDADANYDARKAAKDPQSQKPVKGSYPIGLSNREPQAWVYLVKDSAGQIEKVVLPVYGKGLWSTLYGFVCLEKDLRSIAGLTFYEHAETPGLGGEVENPLWKAKWIGQQVWEQGKPAVDENLRVGVAKGAPSEANQAYEVDGLSGATITSRGVSMLLKYWFSQEGFGPFLKNLASQQGAADGKANS
ncbi:MAG: Na(+)-translocating NADH-quinone reductase subunit C [Pirellulaceae bacterium]|nr:Na(+)-translocating NADH-quinone reductase subunit C [Pirellulaceae bacterium]